MLILLSHCLIRKARATWEGVLKGPIWRTDIASSHHSWSARASIASMRAATLRLHQEFAHAGDHLCAVQLDIRHEGLMRETSHTVFQVQAGRAESEKICTAFLGADRWHPH